MSPEGLKYIRTKDMFWWWWDRSGCSPVADDKRINTPEPNSRWGELKTRRSKITHRSCRALWWKSPTISSQDAGQAYRKKTSTPKTVNYIRRNSQRLAGDLSRAVITFMSTRNQPNVICVCPFPSSDVTKHDCRHSILHFYHGYIMILPVSPVSWLVLQD